MNPTNLLSVHNRNNTYVQHLRAVRQHQMSPSREEVLAAVVNASINRGLERIETDLLENAKEILAATVKEKDEIVEEIESMRHELEQLTKSATDQAAESEVLRKEMHKMENSAAHQQHQPPSPKEEVVASAKKGAGDKRQKQPPQLKCKEPAEMATSGNATGHPPPRRMHCTKNPFYFIHIGKAGGTSVCHMLMSMFRRGQFHGKDYLRTGQNHFDWSYIQQRQRKMSRSKQRLEEFDVSTGADVMTWLRHPVERAISQFYYAKTNEWGQRLRKRGEHPPWMDQTIDEYMNDANRTYTQPLSDGESGVRYLAGTWKDDTGWVSTSPNSDTKRYLRQNKTAATLLAGKRLESTTWFGLLEDTERSLKLLQLTLDLDSRPTLQHQNRGKKKDAASNLTRQKIESYLPQDMWLYDYARRLFEARWAYFAKKGKYVHPEPPPLPDFSGMPLVTPELP